jgi:hypothetical protein
MAKSGARTHYIQENFAKPQAAREQSRSERFRTAKRPRIALKTPGLKLEFA